MSVTQGFDLLAGDLERVMQELMKQVGGQNASFQIPRDVDNQAHRRFPSDQGMAPPNEPDRSLERGSNHGPRPEAREREPVRDNEQTNFNWQPRREEALLNFAFELGVNSVTRLQVEETPVFDVDSEGVLPGSSSGGTRIVPKLRPDRHAESAERWLNLACRGLWREFGLSGPFEDVEEKAKSGLIGETFDPLAFGQTHLPKDYKFLEVIRDYGMAGQMLLKHLFASKALQAWHDRPEFEKMVERLGSQLNRVTALLSTAVDALGAAIDRPGNDDRGDRAVSSKAVLKNLHSDLEALTALAVNRGHVLKSVTNRNSRKRLLDQCNVPPTLRDILMNAPCDGSELFRDLNAAVMQIYGRPALNLSKGIFSFVEPLEVDPRPSEEEENTAGDGIRTESPLLMPPPPPLPPSLVSVAAGAAPKSILKKQPSSETSNIPRNAPVTVGRQENGQNQRMFELEDVLNARDGGRPSLLGLRPDIPGERRDGVSASSASSGLDPQGTSRIRLEDLLNALEGSRPSLLGRPDIPAERRDGVSAMGVDRQRDGQHRGPGLEGTLNAGDGGRPSLLGRPDMRGLALNSRNDVYGDVRRPDNGFGRPGLVPPGPRSLDSVMGDDDGRRGPFLDGTRRREGLLPRPGPEVFARRPFEAGNGGFLDDRERIGPGGDSYETRRLGAPKEDAWGPRGGVMDRSRGPFEAGNGGFLDDRELIGPGGDSYETRRLGAPNEDAWGPRGGVMDRSRDYGRPEDNSFGRRGSESFREENMAPRDCPWDRNRDLGHLGGELPERQSIRDLIALRDDLVARNREHERPDAGFDRPGPTRDGLLPRNREREGGFDRPAHIDGGYAPRGLLDQRNALLEEVHGAGQPFGPENRDRSSGMPQGGGWPPLPPKNVPLRAAFFGRNDYPPRPGSYGGNMMAAGRPYGGSFERERRPSPPVWGSSAGDSRNGDFGHFSDIVRSVDVGGGSRGGFGGHHVPERVLVNESRGGILPPTDRGLKRHGEDSFPPARRGFLRRPSGGPESVMKPHSSGPRPQTGPNRPRGNFERQSKPSAAPVRAPAGPKPQQPPKKLNLPSLDSLAEINNLCDLLENPKKDTRKSLPSQDSLQNKTAEIANLCAMLENEAPLVLS